MTAAADRWRAAWRAVGATYADDALLAEIVRRYAEPHRRYHTNQHLAECFANFDTVRDDAEHPGEIELALWFHDAIYDVRRQDNERRSADWARDSLLNAGVSSEIAGRVHALVMMTQHNALPREIDEKILVDVDLSILGARPERFAEYERQIREEYSWVPQILYRRKRRRILQEFLDRADIYCTVPFRERCERQARDNLRRSVEQLSGWF